MISRRLLLAAASVLALPTLARAHPHEQLTSERQGHIEQQVIAARAAIQQAIATKDVARLRLLYAASFSHTHGSGGMDGRDARIVSVLAGDPVIETARVEELSIRVLHADTAIMTGRSPILNLAENRSYDFRWMQVYVRIEGEWQLAASQATRLPPTT